MKKDKSRYDTSGLIEDQFEPGSRGRVLKNLLGVKRKREINQIEAEEQLRALKEIVTVYGKSHRFTADDIRNIHKIWLGGIYKWAGNYRQVNISKGNFLFAAANQVPRLMVEFEREHLRRYTPCAMISHKDIAKALAIVHTELVLIHPFREGNGRVARMVAVLMALQAGLPLLDFRGIRGKKRDEYFSAVQTGMDRNYNSMIKVFNDVIGKTLGSRVRR